MFYFVLFSLNRNSGYRRTYFRSEKKRKTSFSFAFLSLNRNFETASPTYLRSDKEIKKLFLFRLSLAYS